MRYLVTLCVLGLLSARPGTGQELSGVPAAFVDIGFGARPAALGNAYVGLADDVYSVVWNPAGLAVQTGYQAAFSYVDVLGVVPYNFAAFSAPLPGGGHSAGLAVVSSGDDALRETTLYASYARQISRFAVGASVKYRHAGFGNNTLSEDAYVVFEDDEIAEGLANQVHGSASGFALDLGLTYQASERLGVGLMLRDVVAPVKWNSSTAGTTGDRETAGVYGEAIPFEMAIGTVYRPSSSFLVTADYNPALSGETSNRVRFGTEVELLNVLALRGGIQQSVNELSDEKYALGFGLDLPVMKEVRVQANYTYLFEQLANTQHISVGVSF